ncbi:MAG: tRNA (N(6)-L-threonylcarbamoyladenosine(37)-C(2))-methylthiotransferase MtaB [Bacteroidetes bacterium]|nr:tRNA (N(6)-L-threonylcarbamoyladenosine(37)-C(2))-methylthiotransferase MtaB [Bacteroidota bacterium]MBU1718180.1 tRNA (N(6)-L-threonylcarbamoyladenosine(37)-C(2))-methylthiotransferase MtaB [Bacteroidota bacterium]
MPKTFIILTLGCKLNFAESSSLATDLECRGLKRVKLIESPDYVIINTCTVTNQADSKCRQAISKARRLNPGSEIVITGCYAENEPDAFDDLENVRIVAGNAEKAFIADWIEKLDDKTGRVVETGGICRKPEFHPSWSGNDRTRSFIKIQDGCDYFCGYCTIPFVRGRSRSSTIAQIVPAIRQIAAKGIREVILTGINIGDFGRHTGERLVDLLAEIEQLRGIDRVRISSIEPNLIPDELLHFMAKSEKVLPHLHIPLQSASDRILGLMKRKYRLGVFTDVVQKVISILPHACIATDIIVGYPGETDGDFHEGIDYLNQSPISYMHVFAFSERSGTYAVTLCNQVDIHLRKTRSRELQGLSNRKKYDFISRNIGEKHEVLFESTNNNGNMYGFTGNYIKVKTPFDQNLVNKIVPVVISDVTPDMIASAELDVEKAR